MQILHALEPPYLQHIILQVLFSLELFYLQQAVLQVSLNLVGPGGDVEPSDDYREPHGVRIVAVVSGRRWIYVGGGGRMGGGGGYFHLKVLSSEN